MNRLESKADVRRFETHLMRKAKDLCPKYPFTSTSDVWDCLWAITSSLEGTEEACGDLHEIIRKLIVASPEAAKGVLEPVVVEAYLAKGQAEVERLAREAAK